MRVDDFRYITEDEDSWRWIKPILVKLDSHGFKISGNPKRVGTVLAEKNDIYLQFYLFQKQVYIKDPNDLRINMVGYWQRLEKFVYECERYDQLMRRIRERDIIELLENM